MFRTAASAVMLALAAGPAFAGLHYSRERFAELPSQWRGYLLDHRALRALAVPPRGDLPPSPLRDEYEDAAADLRKRAAGLTADELADLGALEVRLGRPDKAVELLRTAARAHPDHFRLAANLGTAWQLAGDLDQAAVALERAARLAPTELRAAEELHLKLVRLRQREPRGTAALDDLFGVRYAGERPKLPADAPALLQRLGLWLPADGRLLWQLGEVANLFGEVRTAAAVLDGCVGEFGLGDPELRRRRQQLRAAADAAEKDGHDAHASAWPAKSPRPLPRAIDAARLPAVRDGGVTPLGWAVLGQTAMDRRFRPTFPDYLRRLDGKRAAVVGFMQPLTDGAEAGSFLLIEYPVGCWFCETPEPTGIVYVELPPGKSVAVRRGLVKVEGAFALNGRDPEDFLYTLKGATVGGVD